MSAAQRLSTEREHFDVIVIGGGQAGLAMGYYLARRGLRFIILDAHERVGDAWRKRWDSLRLFSPARFDALVGMPFPAPGDSFPTHHEMADYLEAYAKKFQLPVRTGARVDTLFQQDGRYIVRVSGGHHAEYAADQVVVAMSNYQKPRYPETARSLAHDITQIHSSEYRNSQQLKPGPVLVVGAGNSGAEIAFELAREGRRVWLAGRDTGQAPIKITGFWSRVILARLLFRFVFHRLLTIRTPMGRKARPKILSHGTPLIRTRLPELLNAGVTRVARFTTSENGKPRLEDGTVLDVTNVIWSTGFDGGFDWIDLPVFDELGAPIHDGGIVKAQPGFYFVGLNFLYSMSSSMIHGVSRDAARIAKHLSDERHRLLTAH